MRSLDWISRSLSLACILTVAACASGGGMTPSTTSINSPSQPTGGSGTGTSGGGAGASGSPTDNGGSAGGDVGTFAVTAPDRATIGANTTPAPTASTGAANYFALGTAFPLTQTAVRATGGVAPDASVNSAGATLVYGEDGNSSHSTLHVPSLALNYTARSDSYDFFDYLPPGPAESHPIAAVERSFYSLEGFWASSTDTTGAFTYAALTGGYQTPVSAIPSIGSANYKGARLTRYCFFPPTCHQQVSESSIAVMRRLPRISVPAQSVGC